MTSIVILDFWSDRNRGDAAMQVGMAAALRSAHPNANLTVVSAFGQNQEAAFPSEFDETLDVVDRIIGGVRRTYFPLGSPAAPNLKPRTRSLLSLLSTIETILWLAGMRVLPISLTTRLQPKAWRAVAQALRHADLVVWNGRNFRSDSRTREPYDLLHLLIHPLLAKYLGKTMIMVGGSIWPLQRSISVRLLRHVFKNVSIATWREDESLARARELIPSTKTKHIYMPDLSVIPLTENRLSRSDGDGPMAVEKVGLTVVDWRESGLVARENYISTLIATLQDLEATGTRKFILIPQVTIESESISGLAAELQSRFPALEIVHENLSIDGLLRHYSDLDLLIATRMHSCIFALSLGVPVVTIRYDAGAKWRILDCLGFADPGIEFTSASPAAVSRRIEEVLEQKQLIRDLYDLSFLPARRELLDFMSTLVKEAG